MKLNITIDLDSHCFAEDRLHDEVEYVLTLIADQVRDTAEIVLPVYDSTGNERIGQWSITQE